MNKHILFGTVIVSFIFMMINVGNFNAFSEESEDVTLEIKSSKPQFLSNEPVPVLIVVNNNVNSTMTVSDITISSTNFDLDEHFEKPAIPLESSKSI